MEDIWLGRNIGERVVKKSRAIKYAIAGVLAVAAVTAVFTAHSLSHGKTGTATAEMEQVFNEYDLRLVQGYEAHLDFGRIVSLLEAPMSSAERNALVELCMERLVNVDLSKADWVAILDGTSHILDRERYCWKNIVSAFDRLSPVISSDTQMSFFFRGVLDRYKTLCFCCDAPIEGETFQEFRWRKFYAQGMRLCLKNNMTHITKTLCPFVCKSFSPTEKNNLAVWTREYCNMTLAEIERADRAMQEYANKRWPRK